MICKYLGVLKIEEIANIKDLLNLPGDLIAYHMYADESKDLHMVYRRNLIFFQGNLQETRQQPLLRPAADHESFQTIKLRNYTADPNTILPTIQEKLITVVGVDFDFTLTKRQTFYQPDYTNEARVENLVYPDEVRCLLQELASKKNHFIMIVSNNSEDKIAQYLDLWFVGKNPFKKIYGRNFLHSQKMGDKEVCFHDLHREAMRQSPLTPDRYLQLDKLDSCSVLDITSAYIFDDTILPSFSSAGLSIIKVIPKTRTFLIEMKYLFGLEKQKYNLDELTDAAECVTLYKYLYRNHPDVRELAQIAERLVKKLGNMLGTPLHLAVRAGLLHLTRYYLEQNSNVNVVDSENLTPVHYACTNCDILMLKALLEQNTYRDHPEFPMVVTATLTNNEEILDRVLSYKVDINACDREGRTALHHACSYGNPNIIRRLIKVDGVDINCKTKNLTAQTPLHICVEKKRRHACMAMLNAKADVFIQDANGFNPAQLAIVNNNPLVDLLLPLTGDRINDCLKNRRTILTNCIENYYINSDLVFAIITTKWIDLSRKDLQGESPFGLATRLGLGKIVEVLTAAGVSELIEPKQIDNHSPAPKLPTLSGSS